MKKYTQKMMALVAVVGLIQMICPIKLASADLTSTYLVATTGQNVAACGTGTLPCSTVQYAANKANTGDVILVAAGTYTYDAANDTCTFLQTRAVVCMVDKSLTIRGGYSANNWGEAAPLINVTIIDGQSTKRGVAVIGYNTRTTRLTMSGFTIQNGFAQGPIYPGEPGVFGGGMWSSQAAVSLQEMVFRGNRIFGENTTTNAGGSASGSALAIVDTPANLASTIQNATFDQNISQGGTGQVRGGVAFGALFTHQTNVTVEDSTFTNNQAIAGNSSGSGSFGGVAADALGGGIGIEEGSFTGRRLKLTGNLVRGGNAQTSPGNSFGGGIFVEKTTPAILEDSDVSNNTSQAGKAADGGFASGGGLVFYNSAVMRIERSSFIANSVLGGDATSTTSGKAGPAGGGGIHLWSNEQRTSASLLNVIIADNLVQMGAIGNPNAGGGGGGIQLHGVDATIAHATFARNQLSSRLVSGQGVLVLSGGSPSIVKIDYSIIADHTVGGSGSSTILVQPGNTLTLNRGLFSGNTKDSNQNGVPSPVGSISGLNTMLSVASVGFVAPRSPSFNYHLLPTSPAKNQATGSTTALDIDSQSRRYDGAADIGADEQLALNNKLFIPRLTR